MNTLKCMKLPTLGFLTVLEKVLRIPGTLGKPGSGTQAWEEATLGGKTPSLPIEKMLPPVGAQGLPSGAPLVTLGQSPEPRAVPTMSCWEQWHWNWSWHPQQGHRSRLNHSPSSARPPPALSPSATSRTPPLPWTDTAGAGQRFQWKHFPQYPT